MLMVRPDIIMSSSTSNVKKIAGELSRKLMEEF